MATRLDAAIQDAITPTLRLDLEERLPRLWAQAKPTAGNHQRTGQG